MLNKGDFLFSLIGLQFYYFTSPLSTSTSFSLSTTRSQDWRRAVQKRESVRRFVCQTIGYTIDITCVIHIPNFNKYTINNVIYDLAVTYCMVNIACYIVNSCSCLHLENDMQAIHNYMCIAFELVLAAHLAFTSIKLFRSHCV